MAERVDIVLTSHDVSQDVILMGIALVLFFLSPGRKYLTSSHLGQGIGALLKAPTWPLPPGTDTSNLRK